MNKLLVSDFDRTLYIESAISAENMEALTRWRTAGNLFAIATGRAEGILRILMEKYSVTPDFLICNNGANIITQDGTLVAKRYIDRQAVFPLAEMLLQRYGMAIDITLDAGRIQVEREEYAAAPVLSAGISERMTLPSLRSDRRQALQLHMRLPTTAQTQTAAAAVMQQFPQVSAFANECNLDIVMQGTSKAEGIQVLVQWNQFDGKIITIGDSYNDLEMLQLYHGCTLDNANPEIQRQVPRIYKSVAACIEMELHS